MSPLVLVLGWAWGCLLAAPVAVRARRHSLHRRSLVLRAGAPAARSVRAARLTRSRCVRVVVACGALPIRVLGGRAGRRERTRAVERAVPLTLDVLTMAARAGYTPRLALATATRWSPAATSALLTEIERRCRLGSTLVDALDTVGREHPAWCEIADALVVAERSGAPVAELLSRLADDARAGLRRRAEAHARRVPVRLLFPLVFLVLPAFGLLTVVPTLLAGLRNS